MKLRPAIVILLLAATTLQGCGAGAFIVYDGSRKASRDVVGRIMVEKTPDLPSDAAADCVIKGMTYAEVISLGTSDTRRVLPEYTAKVEEVLVRDGVPACLAALPKVPRG